MMQAWSKSLFMAHRTDPAVLSGITTNPTCMKKDKKTQQPKFATLFDENLVSQIFCWDTNKLRAFLWWHALLRFCSTLQTTAFFQIPAFPINCYPYPQKVKLTSSFHAFKTNTHLKHICKTQHCFEPCSEWQCRHKQSSGQNRPFLLSIYHGTGKAFWVLKWQWAVTEVEGNWFMLQKGKLLLDCHQGESPLKPNRSFMNQG